MIWQDVFTNNVKNPRIEGYTLNGSVAYLIISYQTNNLEGESFKTEYFYAIPFNNGQVKPPLGYTGTKRTVDGILGDLSQKRLNSIHNGRIATASYVKGERLRFPRNHIMAGESGSRLYDLPSQEKNGISILPYLWTDGKSAPKFPIDMIKDGQFDSRVKILLLPSTQKRFKVERSMATAEALIATPFYMTLDLMLIPILIINYIQNNIHNINNNSI